MLPINSYTISGIESLKRFPEMGVAQFTLNRMIWPGKRRTVEALRAVRPYHKSKVLVHYDYIYILSRFAMFSNTTRHAIVKELVDLMDYAKFDKTILGVVMHMDWSLKKNITDFSSEKDIIDSYQGTVWCTEKIPTIIKDHYNDWIEYNLAVFVDELKLSVPSNWNPGCKIYLENTTKQGPNKEGSISHIKSILDSNPEYRDYFGICLDSEHFFATEGYYPDFLKLRPEGIDYIVHLNTVPSEVKPKSGKDRHSETTIFECSQNSLDDYIRMVLELKIAKIPFVREVKEDTMFREQMQLKQWMLNQ